MSYFPMFLKMDTLNILLVGGGNIASEKLEKLLDFTANITVVTQDCSLEFKEMIESKKIPLHQRLYLDNECLAYDIVVVATNSITLHKQIFQESRGSRTFVNSVDNTAYCDFIFPSYLQQDDLTIAFSTSGASPAFAKAIKIYFKNKLPNNIGIFLTKMKILRSSIPKGKKRMHYFEELVKEYFEKNFKG